MIFESGIISPASETFRFRSSTEIFVKSSEYKLKAFGTAFERAWTQSVFDRALQAWRQRSTFSDGFRRAQNVLVVAEVVLSLVALRYE